MMPPKNNDLKNWTFCFNSKEYAKIHNMEMEELCDMDTTATNLPAMHMDILQECNDLYARKNHDYGDSFHKTFLEEGFAMSRIRLSDKLERFKTLSRAENAQQVHDESLEDTLKDIINYATMTIMEMRRSEGSHE